jgi:hypothetical protein
MAQVVDGYITLKKWVVFSKTNIVKVATNKPATSGNERAFLLSLAFPVSVFEEPEYKVSVKFAHNELVTNSVDAQAAVEEALSKGGIIAKVEAIPASEDLD